MPDGFAREEGPATPIHVLGPEDVESWAAAQSPFVQTYLAARPFSGKTGKLRVVPDETGGIGCVLAGWGTAAQRAREQFPLGGIAGKLPEGVYQFATGIGGAELENAALGWLLGAYRFTRYKEGKPAAARLVPPEGVNAARLEALANGAALTADLINTPASDMGPEALEAEAKTLANEAGAKIAMIRGAELLTHNFPMIHAVGRASDQAPRLVDFGWGEPDAPKVTLVGKGVCFDTGGLNLKPGGSMALMKKDMGGAATVLGLAQVIMALGLPIRLRVLIPAVENSISAGAFRPGDVLTSRKGLTVEVNNTDAEGRLVLADALALADEDAPELLVSMATLTGAARVALGPDVPPFFTDDEALAGEISDASQAAADPLWRLPFWEPYEAMIEPDIADLDNAPKGGFAGAITAALFLRRFVEDAGAYVHVDCYGWTPTARPGRPKGGASQGARALLGVIERRFGAGG